MDKKLAARRILKNRAKVRPCVWPVLNSSFKQSTAVGHVTRKAEYYTHRSFVLTRSDSSGTY